MPSDQEPTHLAPLGGAKGITFTSSDFKAMDLALSLVPELRIAAFAVRLAQESGTDYPIVSPSQLTRLLGETAVLQAGGHEMDGDSIHRFFVSGDFPIGNEAELVSRVYVALNRCRHLVQLQLSLRQFEEGLAAPVEVGEGD
jgi:hypothetical protein